MPTLPLRDYLYLGAILVLTVGFLWYRHSLIVEGEAKRIAWEQKLSQVQALADAKVSQETVDGLKSDLDKARALANQPPSPGSVQLRYITRACPAIPAASGSESRSSPGGSLPGVSEGDRAGPDPIPSLRELAEAAEVVAAYDRACLKWARGIAK